MVQTPPPNRASYLSTGVVSRLLGLNQSAVRAMIELGDLPEPQWVTLGKRVERIYSLEWLELARAQVNARRLAGLEDVWIPPQGIQFAIRFDRATWDLPAISSHLNALHQLWQLCGQMLSESGATPPPELHIRRISAGSPMDILGWASDNWHGALGTGGLIWLFVYLIRNPEKVAEALPKAIAAGREGWARADDAAVRRIQSKIARKEFERDAKAILGELRGKPKFAAIDGNKAAPVEAGSDGTEDDKPMPELEAPSALDDGETQSKADS